MKKNVKVVIGCSNGDEGKGLVTDYFASRVLGNCIVVLSNGGSQRGHTVTLPDKRNHVFKHFGSGTYLGAYTYLPSYYIVNPMNYVSESVVLKNQKVDIPKMFINPRCKISTPFDMIANMMIEEYRGDKKHGSCGLGIWETILRNGVTVEEMAAKTDLEKKEYLTFVRDDYFAKRISSKGITTFGAWEKIIYSDSLIEHYIYDFNYMLKTSVLTDDTILNTFDNIIFENGQGLLLDQNNGAFTTPSNTGLKNPSELINGLNSANNNIDVEVCYVTRTYLTKHGVGYLENECDKDEISIHIGADLTNVYNSYQGSLRYGVLDWYDLEKRVLKDFSAYSKPHWKLSIFFTHTNECNILDFNKIANNYHIYLSNGKTRENTICLDNK